MAQKTVEELFRKVTFTEEKKLKPLVEKLFEAKKDGENETVQVIINIKGYENRKDQKMTKDIVFPHIFRVKPSICVMGGDACKDYCEKNNIPFYNSNEYASKGPEEKKKVIKQYQYFILSQDYQVGFNLKDILKRRRSQFMCPQPEKIPELYKSLLYTYKMKIRDWYSVSFPVGHCEQNVNQIVENIQYGMQFLADNLKKGCQNIKACYLKKTQGECMRFY